ncbi:MAG: hypothetical protein AABN33_27710 [Acidobacteriota bacterium]
MKRNLKLLVVPFLLLAAVGVAQVKNNSGRIKDALPAGINLNDAKSVEIRDEAGNVVLSGTFSNFKAPLSSKDAATKAKGLAEIEIEKAGTGTKQEIEVEVEKLPALATFKLIVDGNEVATFTTSKAGKRDLKYTRKDH